MTGTIVQLFPHGRSGARSGQPRSDLAFLPAALEILETPASPVRLRLLSLICALALAALAWSYFGKIDIVATAQGKVQPLGRVKVVQSLETGKITTIRADNGTRVRKGQVLIELDATETLAEKTALATALAAVRGEIARRRAVLAEVVTWGDDHSRQDRQTGDAPAFPDDTPLDIRQRERANYHSELSALRAGLDHLEAQREQKRMEIARLDGAADAQRALIATLAERVSMRAQLVESQSGSKASLLEATQALQEAGVALATLAGQRVEAEAAVAVLQREADKLLQGHVSDNVDRRSQALRQADELEQSLVKASRRHRLMTIVSPCDGVVQASALTTVGQVVVTGTELMRIVPADAVLEIEAYLPNRDIGFVAEGQQAIIKIEAFPFTRYGVLEGRVIHVATDAIPEPDARQVEGEPASSLRSLIPAGNTQRVQNLVFPVSVAPTASMIAVDGREVPLSPGMAATVEIRTGQRRILEYLFSPLAEIGSSALKER